MNNEFTEGKKKKVMSVYIKSYSRQSINQSSNHNIPPSIDRPSPIIKMMLLLLMMMTTTTTTATEKLSTQPNDSIRFDKIRGIAGRCGCDRRGSGVLSLRRAVGRRRDETLAVGTTVTVISSHRLQRGQRPVDIGWKERMTASSAFASQRSFFYFFFIFFFCFIIRFLFLFLLLFFLLFFFFFLLHHHSLRLRRSTPVRAMFHAFLVPMIVDVLALMMHMLLVTRRRMAGCVRSRSEDGTGCGGA